MKAKLILVAIFLLVAYGCWPLLPNTVSGPSERWFAGQIARLDQQILAPGKALDNHWRRLGLTGQSLPLK